MFVAHKIINKAIKIVQYLLHVLCDKVVFWNMFSQVTPWNSILSLSFPSAVVPFRLKIYSIVNGVLLAMLRLFPNIVDVEWYLYQKVLRTL